MIGDQRVVRIDREVDWQVVLSARAVHGAVDERVQRQPARLELRDEGAGRVDAVRIQCQAIHLARRRRLRFAAQQCYRGRRLLLSRARQDDCRAASEDLSGAG